MRLKKYMPNNELTTANKQALATLDNGSLSELIKPLTNEIHLFDTYISGLLQNKDNKLVKELKKGDCLKLIREVTKFDDLNINILTNDGKKIGYIPEKDNVIFARLMDAGKHLIAKITDISKKGMFPIISIGIYLIDY